MQRPDATEYFPYFETYVSIVPDGNFLDTLRQNGADVIQLFGELPADKHNYAYAEGKWSVKEVLMHITDVERVMSYRALVAARGDSETMLCSMDDKLYLKNSNAAAREMKSLIEEFAAVRNATLKFFETVTEEQSRLTANVNSHPTSARALGYIIAGHAMHHTRVVQERYLV